MELASIDGEVSLLAEAKVSALDRGLLYGDGVYEAIRFWKRGVFRLSSHMDRLRDSLGYLDIPMPSGLSHSVIDLTKQSGLESGYIRVIITRGRGHFGIDVSNVTHGPTEVILVTNEIPTCLKVTGATARVVEVRQLPAWALNPKFKTLNYANKVLAQLEARRMGYDIPILLNSEGRISECGTQNLFAVVSGKVVTPPLSEGMLAGVTRDSIITICQAAGIPFEELRLTPSDLQTSASELFVTGTGAGVLPVSLKLPPAFNDTGFPVASRLRELYIRAISGELEGFSRWRTVF